MKAAITVPKNIDYKDIGLKVGLEIHQQLNTRAKLFCNCPVSLVSDSTLSHLIPYERFLRATKSELGEVDTAAAFEFQRQRVFKYLLPPTASCLVELDEEPPHPLNKEALITALAIALAIDSFIVDEVHVMRKIVIDGSNTTGFQRTAIVALGGHIADENGDVRVQSIAIEEDAARKISEDVTSVTYSLDRLGIPLIEISTAPDITTPVQARRIAEKIGLMLRFTGKAKRGIGTIRQDLNLSISGSPKIEIKGIQKLELIPKVIEEEVRRLIGLIMIRDLLIERGASVEEMKTQPIIDVTDILIKSSSRFILNAIKEGGKAYAIKAPKFDGILGVELQTNRRFGTELADYARQWAGVKGIVHSDELPGYGINESDIKELRSALEIKNSDAFIIVVDRPEKAKRALEVVRDRCAMAIIGIPKETRAANDDGTTRYMRPQPGAARMYPETDIPPIRVTSELIEEAKNLVPPTVEEKVSYFIKVYNLSFELAKQLVYSEYMTLFEQLVGSYGVNPKILAMLFTSLYGELKKNGIDIDLLSDATFHKIASVIKSLGDVSKDDLLVIVETVYRNPQLSVEEAVFQIKSQKTIDVSELRELVRSKITAFADEVKKRGDKAFQFIMGKIMNEVRGRIDGKIVAKVVKEELESFLKDMKT
ncbi:MAG: Glu-tRNA(Gln) amidotransferase subunit GatE [Ignisphaera sp.]|jgi:glutamyl-tRNA(Gln) amidotransferase subunit E|nr:Glu-tRNA(Gln) amidotransferase subunit GatE [Ignisphaera sp.]MCC6056728.1 Glu-tRNA(Gln) amidotransferase subunit GatE [Desulfurococcaceae archaeon]